MRHLNDIELRKKDLNITIKASIYCLCSSAYGMDKSGLFKKRRPQ